MKKILLFAAAVALLLTANYANQPKTIKAFDYKLEPKKVSENVWCFFGALEGPNKSNAGAMVNTCYIKTKDSFVVLDSGPSYEYAKQSYEQMSKIAKLPVNNVILSHDHDDHWLGNSFYKEKFNAKLLGPHSINTNYKEGDETRMFRVLPKEAIKGTKIIKVDKSYEKSQLISIGGEMFEIVVMGRKAHTQDDYFVYMPKRKVLFAGDLAMNGRITSNRDGSLLGQIKAVEMMRSREWDILVPGHGFNVGKSALDEAERYFTLLHEGVVKALEDDVEMTDIGSVVTMEEFKDKAMF
ncbi:MAG: MBL fold metallo-hydrolase, partial [Campylobacterota bacterium]|nr:MBL fold metallo-hydrolase [Campylobacterota bacterium]